MVHFETATLSDIPALITLLHRLFEQEEEFQPDRQKQQDGLKQILENENLGFILLARQGKDIIGMVNILFTVSTALGGRVGILEDMVVLPEVRNKGIGSTLMEAAVKRAKEAGCLRMTLLTDVDNEKAHRFYEQGGFSKSSMVVFRTML